MTMTVQKRQKLVTGIALLVNIEFQWYKVRRLFGCIGGGGGKGSGLLINANIILHILIYISELERTSRLERVISYEIW